MCETLLPCLPPELWMHIYQLMHEIIEYERTIESIVRMVSSNGCSILYITPRILTDRIKCAAIDNDPMALRYIANQDEKLILRAVRICGLTLRHAEYQTDAIRIAAIASDDRAIAYVRY